jgi:AcrR family transcriptional regulator
MAADQEDAGDGRRARWEQHNLDRRQLIVEAAIAVIEEQPPGAEFHIRQIAERAQVPRAAIYRHFVDRADLDREVRLQVLGGLRDRLFAEFVLEGSINEVIGRIVRSYVEWADAHPALHRLGDSASYDGEQPGPLHETLQQIASQVHELIALATTVLQISLTDEDDESLDLLIFGLVSEMMGIVRHWLWRPVRAPGSDTLAELMTGLVWSQFDTLARERGLVLDPDARIEDLVAAALAQSSTGAGG